MADHPGTLLLPPGLRESARALDRSSRASLRAERLDAPTSEWDLDPATGRAVVTAPMDSSVGADEVETWIVVNWFEELRRLAGGG